MPIEKRNSSFFGLDNEGCGITLEQLGEAIAVWISTTSDSDERTVAEISDAFNVEPAVIAKAAELYPWTYVFGPDDDYSKQKIGLDGA